jgi:hypothetical protein
MGNIGASEAILLGILFGVFVLVPLTAFGIFWFFIRNSQKK